MIEIKSNSAQKKINTKYINIGHKNKTFLRIKQNTRYI